MYTAQGLVDLDAEISKCEKKLQLAQLNLDKVKKTESAPDYESTVPETVRTANTEKVCVLFANTEPWLTQLHSEDDIRSRDC